jgi:DNA gyrase subunit A
MGNITVGVDEVGRGCLAGPLTAAAVVLVPRINMLRDSKVLTAERFGHMNGLEQFILTVSANGYGKRSSSYEYRLTGRGGKGIVAMTVNKRNGELVASFPVNESDEIMLVSDGGQLIRCPVHDIRVAGRSTQGVTLFDMVEDEHVVSVEHIPEDAEAGQGNGNGG